MICGVNKILGSQSTFKYFLLFPKYEPWEETSCAGAYTANLGLDKASGLSVVIHFLRGLEPRFCP